METGTEPALRFGYEKTITNARLFVKVPVEVISSIEERKDTAKQLRWLTANRQRLIDVDSNGESSQLYVNFKKLGGTRDDQEKRSRGIQILHFLDTIQAYGKDPLIFVEFGTSQTKLGRYSFQADIAWPVGYNDEQLRIMTTIMMRATAKSLKYVNPDFVYAQVRRSPETMVSLIANDLGGCEADTYGGYNRPDQARFQLSAGNLLHPDMELICFSGAVAIAHPEDLAAPLIGD